MRKGRVKRSSRPLYIVTISRSMHVRKHARGSERGVGMSQHNRDRGIVGYAITMM